MVTVHMIGNAHLDPAWFWRWPAGAGEALATCRAACDLLDADPEVVFTRSDAWVYERIEAFDPALFERIRGFVASGRWAVVGGWYVQPDCNLPLAGSFEKHIEIGRRYARERLGVEVTVGYNVDSFGHSASLPALLAAGGYDSYVFMRPMAHEKKLPSSLFRWRSPPGAGGGGPAEVLAWRLPAAYCSGDEDLTSQVEAALACAAAGIGHVMCFYGVGDHGGGPTRAQVAWIRTHRDSFAGARLLFSHPRAFFDAVKPDAARLPVVQGELQMHSIGCYSVLCDIKQGMRRAETAVLSAERAATVYSALTSPQMPGVLERAWKRVLFNQFHDIYGGTCIPEACTDAVDELATARTEAEQVTWVLLFRRAVELPPAPRQRIVVFNPGPDRFDGLVRWEPWLAGRPFPEWIADEGGRPVPHQRAPSIAIAQGLDGLLWPVRIEPDGMRVYTLREGSPASSGTVPSAAAPEISVAERSLSNGRWTVSIPNDGGISLAPGVEPPLGLSVRVQEDPSDTWSHGIDRFAGPVAGTFAVASVAVEERGPLRATLRLAASFGRSTLSLRIRICRGDPRLELELRIDWHEQRRIAKLVIAHPRGIAGRTDGVQIGGLDRQQDGREYPLIDWTVLRPAAGRAVTVACPDCFALSGSGGEAGFTLLRSPAYAWHDPAVLPADRAVAWTDQGQHDFRFALRLGGDGAAAAEDARGIRRPPSCLDWTKGM